MSPRLAREDRVNIGDIDTKFSGQCRCAKFVRVGNVYGANMPNRFFVQLRAMNRISALDVVAALRDRILCVVLGSPKEQVSRVYTGRVVTLVQHPEAIGYWPVLQHVGDAMRPPLRAMAKQAIPFPMPSAPPFPAIVITTTIYLLPESLFVRRLGLRRHHGLPYMRRARLTGQQAMDQDRAAFDTTPRCGPVGSPPMPSRTATRHLRWTRTPGSRP